MNITKKNPVALTRTSEQGTRAFPASFTRIRDLGQAVAFYFADNLITSRQEATKLGMAAELAFRAGESFEAHGITFTITPASPD